MSKRFKNTFPDVGKIPGSIIVALLCFTCSLAQQHPAIVVPTGHSGGVTAMASNKDGSRIFTIGLDGLIKCWDSHTGLEMSTIRAFKSAIKSIENACLDISPDEKFVVAANRMSGEIKLFNVQSGTLYASFKNSKTGISSIRFSPDGKSIFTGSMDGFERFSLKGVLIQNYEPLTTTEQFPQKLSVENFLFTPNGEVAAVCFSNVLGGKDKQQFIKLINLATGVEIKRLPYTPLFIHNTSFSADSKKLLIGDNNGVTLFDLTNDFKTHIPGFGAQMAIFDKTGEKIITSSLSGGLLKTIDASSLKELSAFFDLNPVASGEVTGLDLLPGTDLLMRCINSEHSSGGGTVEIWDVNQKTKLKELTGSGSIVHTASFTPDGKNLVTGSGDGMARVWDLSYGKLEKSIPGASVSTDAGIASHYEWIKYSPDARWLAINYSVQFELYDQQNKTKLVLGYSPVDAACFSAEGRFLVTSSGNLLHIWKCPTAENGTFTSLRDINTGRRNGNIQFVGTGKILCEGDNSALLFDINSGSKLRTFELGMGSVVTGDGLADSNFLVIGGGFTEGEFAIFDVRNGKKVYDLQAHTSMITDLDVLPSANRMVTASSDKTAKVWDMSNPQNPSLLFVLSGHKDVVTSCSFSNDERFIVTTSEDKTAKVWSATTGEELATLIAIGEEWLLVTAEGYYFASRNGAKVVHFVADNKVFYFDQYDLQYNRPDLVLKKLGIAAPKVIEAYRKAYEKRLRKMGFSLDQFQSSGFTNAPQLTVLNSGNNLVSTAQKNLDLKFSIADEFAKIERINISVNGVPLYGKKGMSVKPDNTSRLTKTISLELTAGKNRVSLSVLNDKGIESLTESFEIEYIARPIKPSLYLLCIGAGKYRNAAMNLSYSRKDAEDISGYFQKSASHYQEVIPLLLTDTQVTKKNILDLKSTLAKSRPEDEVIIFYAGHGILDDSLDYFLGTYDMDFNRPSSRGIQFDQLEDLLDGIPSRKKILLMDACHSGEVDKEDIVIKKVVNASSTGKVVFRSVGNKIIERKQVGLKNSFELMKQLFVDLRKSTGATVISSAGGAEYAWEGDQWKNGVFTYCLLSGLKERKSDLNNDGKVMLSELLLYLQNQVEFITQGKQIPTSRSENLVEDFQLW